jgi:hypothetical protein
MFLHRDSLEDAGHSDRPRMVGNELKMQEFVKLLHANCSQMVEEVTAAAGISHGTCHKILSDDLNMSHVIQRSVPCILMHDQRDDHVSTCRDLINSVDKDGTFLNQITTGDETWFFCTQLKQ